MWTAIIIAHKRARLEVFTTLIITVDEIKIISFTEKHSIFFDQHAVITEL